MLFRENRYDTAKRMTMKKETEIRYFIYARKSTEDEDRQVLSLDSQEKTLGELAARFNLKIAKTFRESHSAKAPDARSIFANMMDRIKRGEAHGIVCWKLDRLARNPDEAGRIIKCSKQKKSCISKRRKRIITPKIIRFCRILNSASQTSISAT